MALVSRREQGSCFKARERGPHREEFDGRPELFYRRADRRELGVEPGAYALHGGDDDDADTGRDQAIFDRGRAGPIRKEFCNQFAHLRPLYSRRHSTCFSAGTHNLRLEWFPAD